MFHCQYDFTCEFRPMHLSIYIYIYTYIYIYICIIIRMIYILYLGAFCISDADQFLSRWEWMARCPDPTRSLPGFEIWRQDRLCTTVQCMQVHHFFCTCDVKMYSVFFYIFMHFTLQAAGPKSMNSPLWCIPFKSILLRYGRYDMIVKRCWRVLKFKL